MGKSHLALVAPTTVNGTVDKAGPPKRRRNAEVRSREYLTEAEVNRLISAAGENRNGHRDATMILVAYRAGGRAGHAALGRRRFCPWPPPCEPTQAQFGVRPPVVRPRAAGAAPAQARSGPGVAIYVHVRTWFTIYDGGIPQDGRPARCGR